MNANECRARAAEVRALGRRHTGFAAEAERIAERFETLARHLEGASRSRAESVTRIVDAAGRNRSKADPAA